jgi:hypothetical protein
VPTVTTCIGTGTLSGAVGYEATDHRGRRIGRVEEVVASVDPRVLDAVVLRTGLFGRHVALLPGDHLTEVVPLLRLLVTDA